MGLDADCFEHSDCRKGDKTSVREFVFQMPPQGEKGDKRKSALTQIHFLPYPSLPLESADASGIP